MFFNFTPDCFRQELMFVSQLVHTTWASKSSYRCAIHTTQLDVNNKVCDTTLHIGANENWFFSPSLFRDWLFYLSDPIIWHGVLYNPGLGSVLPHPVFQKPSALGHLRQSVEHRSIDECQVDRGHNSRRFVMRIWKFRAWTFWCKCIITVFGENVLGKRRKWNSLSNKWMWSWTQNQCHDLSSNNQTDVRPSRLQTWLQQIVSTWRLEICLSPQHLSSGSKLKTLPDKTRNEWCKPNVKLSCMLCFFP